MSVRGRLTFTGVALIALALALFGVAVRFGVERVLRAGLDNSLRDHAERRARGEIRGGGRFDGGGGPRGDGPPGRQGGLLRGLGRPPQGALLPPHFIGRDRENVPQDQAAYSASGLDDAFEGRESVRDERPGQGEEPLRVFSLPVRAEDGELLGVVQTAISLMSVDGAVEGVTEVLLLLAPVVLALSGITGAILAGWVLRPVGKLASAAERIGATNLSERLPEGPDEFGRLGGAFNGVLGRMEAAFARERRFTADASHELRTPIATIQAASQLLEESDLSEAERREIARAIHDSAARSGRIVKDLLLLARGESGSLPVQRESVALGPLFGSLISSAKLAADAPQAQVTVKAEENLALSTDPHLLGRLVGNLLENALRHTPPEGCVTLSANRMGDALTIVVADTGEGIAPEHLARLFEPFYRVDAARTRASGGAGLGLSIARALAESLGGTLALASAPGKGTTATLTLPLEKQTIV